ncbi:MAG: NAD(P)-binding domain-containing protein [Cyanobacteriota bacterium]|nr:NAD(P)-binding domain-containing protein [Cyanobacteriota bacterium]
MNAAGDTSKPGGKNEINFFGVGFPIFMEWLFLVGPLSVFLVPVAAGPSILVPFTAIFALYVLALFEPWRKRTDDEKASPMKKAVAVVGAGPSGIAAVKEFVAAGQDVTCFEAADSVGGLFARCYDRAVLTSSAAITAFSDFPPDPVEHRHFTKDEYKTYLERYVDHFSIRPLIHLRSRVEKAKYDPEQGGWLLQVSQADGVSEAVGPFDTLVVCSGLNQVPNLPAIDSTPFSGQVLHSKDYRNALPFAGKKVVVVGLGETSADVVAEIAEVAASVTLSLRRGAYVIPRINPLTGYPNDYDSNRLRYSLPKWAHNLAVSTRDRALARWGNSESKDRFRLELLRKPGTPAPMNQFATKSDNFVRAIESGRCKVVAGLSAFTPEGVTLVDGERIAADVVLFATGYKAQGYSFLDDPSMPGCPSELWHLMYSPVHRERLVFIGYARPAIGAIPPIAEIQARYAALVTSGQRALPTPEVMGREFEQRLSARAISFNEPRIVALVDWIPYMDHLAEKIGCRVRASDLLLRPRLAWRLATGTMLVAQYRLTGPDAKAELAERSLQLPGGMRPVDKLWFIAFHGLVAVTAIWEALPGRRRYRHCGLI